MGKKDTITKAYMSKPEYFADAFNFYMFEGEQVVKADELCAVDSTELGIIFKNENDEIVQKVRDVLKHCVLMEDGQFAYLMLGIENHMHIHYALPVKNMIYDALNYGKQVSQKVGEHKERKDIQGDEFLSGFSKTDKIKPVILCGDLNVAHKEEWDAPRSLKEMFGDTSEKVLRYVSDYKLNLIVPKEIEDFSKFETDFGKVMKYISVADKKELWKVTAEEESYKIVDVETAQLLRECVGMKIVVDEEKKEVNMCKALRDIMEEGREEGREEAIDVLIKTLLELGQTECFILSTIINKFELTEEKAKKYVAKIVDNLD